MKHKNILLTAAALVLSTGGLVTAIAQNQNDITDPAIIYPESFEMDAQKRLESWYLRNYTATDSAYKEMPDIEVSDAVIIQRLQQMPTIIEMPFNSVVKDHIKRYTKDSRAQVAALLGLGIYYNPIFEQALEEKGLPLELKYLPVVESALDPNKVTSKGNAGLWGFSLAGGQGMGLVVNSLVDERRDPYRSSECAAALLKELYESYGDWSLAIVAFNVGQTEVNKAINRAGGNKGKKLDFWSIYSYLSPEARAYVPAFIAANYVMTYHNEHNIHPVLATKPLATDTVAVRERISLQHIASVLDIPVEELRDLNPQFRTDIVPAPTADKQYMLILPSMQAQAYLMSEDEIIAYNRAEIDPRERVEPGDVKGSYVEPIQDRVRTDDVAAVQPQQQQQQPPKKDNKKTQQTQSTQTAQTQGDYITHKVKSGESLADIAKQYGVDPEDIRKWNDLPRANARTGQKLKIYKPGNTQTAQAEPVKQPTKQTTQTQQQKPVQQQTAQTQQTATQQKGRNKQQNNTQQTTQQQTAQTNQQPNKKSGKQQTTPQQQNQVKTDQTANKGGKGKQQEQAKADQSTKGGKGGKGKQQEQAKADQNTKGGKGGKGKQQEQAKADQNTKGGKGGKGGKGKQQEQAKADQNNKGGKGGKGKQQEQAKADQNNKGGKGGKGKQQQQPAQPKSHDVKKGDSLDRIARQNGVSVDEVRKANPNIKGDVIHPGDKVNIPQKKQQAAQGKGAKADQKADQNKKGGKADTKKQPEKKADQGKKGGKKKK